MGITLTEGSEVETPDVETPEEGDDENGEETVAPTEAKICKRPGCANEWVTARGPYGHLCEMHAAKAKKDRQKARKPKPLASRPTSSKNGSLVSLCENWLAAKADLDHAAAEIRDRTGTDPEQFIADLKGLKNFLA